MNFKNIFLVISTIITIGMTGCGSDTNSNAATNRASGFQNLANIPPAILPVGITITASAATLVSTKNTTYGVDVDGNIPPSGLVVKVSYHSNRDIALNDFTSSPFTIKASNTKSGTAIDVRFQWRNIHLSAGDGYFNAKIVPIGGTYHARQLDLNANGYTAATLSYQIDGNSSIGQLDLKVIPGIPDRNFNVLTNGKYEHQFVYMPVKSATGRVWLNNNLGAAFADINSGYFSPHQQATSATDYRAYGSLFQWGRKADGHELINWKSSTAGTPKYGTTTTKSNDPTSPLFIKQADWRVNGDDTLWASESSQNNVCPVGYRLPLDPSEAEDSSSEFNAEVDTWSSKNKAGSLSSNLKLTMPGFRWFNNGFYYARTYGLYWSGTASSNNSITSHDMRLGNNSMFLSDTTKRGAAMSVRCIKKYDLAAKEFLAYVKSNGKPTLQEYIDAGMTGVTANSLDAINAAIRIMKKSGNRVTLLSIQHLIDNLVPLPTGVTITAPTLTATLVSTIDTTYGVDVDGNISSSGLVVKVPYHSDRYVTLDDFTSPIYGVDNPDSSVFIKFQWSGVSLSAGDGYFDAKIVPMNRDCVYHIKKLGLDESGYRAATFLYPTDDHASVGELDLNVIPGIPDRNFNVLTNGKYEHQFVYMPVKSSTGRVWLNNNLGAAYADLNSPDFNSTQQATASDDYKAYGSMFQWGRKADGHELINWENNTTGTPIYGTTTTKSDNPTNPSFITSSFPYKWRVNQDDTLWASESSPNNVCPVGYRLPLNPNGAEDSDNEFSEELNTWSSKYGGAGSLSSKLKLPIAGVHSGVNNTILYQNKYGVYWSGSVDQSNARSMHFGDAVRLSGMSARTTGLSVRCIKN